MTTVSGAAPPAIRRRRPARIPAARVSVAAGLALAAGAWGAPVARAGDAHAVASPPVIERAADGASRVRFQADRLFDRQGRDAIESGVTATVVVTWEIDHPRGLWLDETLERATEVRTLSYDNVTKRYRVDVPDGAEGHYETSSFDEAERRIGAVDAPIRTDLDSAGSKVLRVRLSCDSRDGMLPLGLEKVLFFLPGWGFDTGWVTLALP